MMTINSFLSTSRLNFMTWLEWYLNGLLTSEFLVFVTLVFVSISSAYNYVCFSYISVHETAKSLHCFNYRCSFICIYFVLPS